jgi:hypothetical protein
MPEAPQDPLEDVGLRFSRRSPFTAKWQSKIRGRRTPAIFRTVFTDLAAAYNVGLTEYSEGNPPDIPSPA